MQPDDKYSVWLSSIEGVGSKRFFELVRHFGSAKAVYENACISELNKIFGMGDKLSSLIINSKNIAQTEDFISKFIKYGIDVFIFGQDNYPILLSQILDPPPVLYVKGKIPLMLDKPIAMVGTRKCTRYGRKVAHTLSKELAQSGITVISGLARGIDTYSHTGAIEGGGYTIAVMGCGVDLVYPPENRELYHKIQENGAIVSSYFPGTEARATHFPSRNRIISGLSKGVIVVESADKGGALITADFALEQGRDVFAVPGNIDSIVSEATNKLIRDGAIPALGISDILDNYGWGANSNKKAKKEAMPELNLMESKVYSLLLEGAMHYDELALLSNFSDGELASCLTMMELKGIIVQLPGRRYEIC